MNDNLTVVLTQQHDKRLGRNLVHDARSRAFATGIAVDRTTWRDKAIRIYDPRPNLNQCHGECTACAKAMQLNAVGNRRTSRVLGMGAAHLMYARNTEIDPFEGTWPPDDTGSSGLASCKSAIEQGLAGEYVWEFGGADGIIQNVMAGRVMSVGTWWHWNMMTRDPDGRLRLGGGMAGGHQYVIRGYWKDKDWALGRCWWGEGFRDFWISRFDLDTLVRDDGDAHWQRTT